MKERLKAFVAKSLAAGSLTKKPLAEKPLTEKPLAEKPLIEKTTADAGIQQQREKPTVFSGPAIQLPAQADGRPAGVTYQRRGGTIFTLDGVRRAWLSVRQAGGGAGVDGVSLAHFEASLEEQIGTLYDELSDGRYQPRPVRQVWVPKANGGMRTLAMWAIRDRVAQRTVYELLLPQFEPLFLPCSYGFRPERNVEQAVQQVVQQRNANKRWVVDADIQHCFDTIDSDRLLTLVRRHVRQRLLIRYVARWLHADILNSADGASGKAGTSQGNVLSPLLANIYLHEFDQALTQQKLALVRYADDFVICCQRKEDAQHARELADAALQRIKLSLHPQKSQIVHFDQGFNWLGYFFIRNECFRM